MKQRIALFSALPLVLLAAPAFGQVTEAPPAPPPNPAAAEYPTPEAVQPAAPGRDAARVDTAERAAPLAPVVEPAKADDKPAEPAPAPEKLSIAKTGFFQPSANFQVWAWAQHLGNARTDDNEWTSTFRIRRAEIKAKGELIPKTLGYVVMFDPARLLDLKSGPSDVTDASGTKIGSGASLQVPANGSTSILQDVQLTYLSDYADVSIGQFKIPVSLEGFGAASKLYFPERSLVARRYGDRRDIGLKVEKKFEHFSYFLGVYNGEGQNNLDSNDQKDLALRLEVYPIKDVTVAVVGYTGVGDRDLVGTKDRIEADIKLEKAGLLLQAEAIRAWDMTGTADKHTRVRGQGFYVLAGYTFFDKLQPIVRVGSVDPEIGKDEQGATEIDKLDEVTAYEFGLNYYVKQHDAKLQLAASVFDPEQRVQKTTVDVILATQIAF